MAMSIRVCGGRFRSIRLESPPNRVRPTTDRVREAIFSTLVHDIQDARVLDLFAGSGALGIESISRGASHVTFVEQDRGCIDVIRKNIAATGAGEQAVIIRSDVRTFLKTCIYSYTVIFMDPPYHKGLACELAPHVYNLLDTGGILVVEHATTERITMQAWKQKRYGDTSISYYVRSE